MTTIEELLNTIQFLKEIAEQAIELANEYSGNDSEMADELEEALQKVIDEHNQNN
jgi:hypothetical protein